MWKIIGYAAGILPIIVDLIQNSGTPSWVSGAGAALVTTTGVAHRIKRKREAGAPTFRTRR